MEFLELMSLMFSFSTSEHKLSRAFPIPGSGLISSSNVSCNLLVDIILKLK